MKAKHLHLLLIAALGAPALSSCNLINDFTNILHKDKSSAATPIEVLNDRETVRTEAPAKAYTSAEIGKGIVKGDWAIDSVMGKRAHGETAPYIKFEPQQKRIYGSDGCNTINATYNYNPADSTFRFENILSTMRLCSSEGVTDVEIMQALNNTKYYSWRIDENDYLLTFFDSHRQPLMLLLHQNFDFLNGTWSVTAINGKNEGAAGMRLVIDVDESKIHGNTGCNLLNGTLEIEMEAPNSISFSNLITTRMACDKPEKETDLLVALEETVSAKALANDRVVFLNAQGQPVLEMKRDKSI